MDARDQRSRTDERLVGFDASHAARAWTTLAALDAPDVVVIGAGIAGTQLAARLARRGAKVALVTGGPLPPRRLIDGCSLRRATVQTMAEAFGVDVTRLHSTLHEAQSGFDRLRITTSKSEAPIVEPQFEAGDGREGRGAIGLSARHADIITTLRGLVPSEVALVPGEVTGYLEEQHRLSLRLPTIDGCDWPLSPRTTVVNTQGRRVGSAGATAPRYWVAAAQQPIAMPAGTLDRVGWAPSYRGELGWHLGFVTPFWDSAAPTANAYAINTLVIDDATLQQATRDRVLADVRAGLDRCVRACGATAIDPDETTGAAVVPVVEDFEPTLEGGLVELHAALSPGAPAINVDGMLAQSIGIAALGEALPELLGEEALWIDASRAIERALGPVRRWNRTAAWNYFRAPYWLRRVNQKTLSVVGARVVRQWADLGR